MFVSIIKSQSNDTDDDKINQNICFTHGAHSVSVICGLMFASRIVLVTLTPQTHKRYKHVHKSLTQQLSAECLDVCPQEVTYLIFKDVKCKQPHKQQRGSTF